MQVSWESSVASSSFNNNSTCARLVSSSPPESFTSSCQLPRPTSLSAASPSLQQYRNGPAVLLVSEDEVYYVEDVKPPTVLETSVSCIRENSPSVKEDTSAIIRMCGSRHCRRTTLLVLAVSLLVFGGLVIPITCLTILQHDRDAEKSTPPRTQQHRISCCNFAETRFQFSFIGQGLLLSIIGVLLITRTKTVTTDVCSDKESTNSALRGQIQCSQPVVLCTMIVSTYYAIMLVNIGFNVWQILNITIYCNWSSYTYTVLISTELIASLLSAVSTAIISLLGIHTEK